MIPPATTATNAVKMAPPLYMTATEAEEETTTPTYTQEEIEANVLANDPGRVIEAPPERFDDVRAEVPIDPRFADSILPILEQWTAGHNLTHFKFLDWFCGRADLGMATINQYGKAEGTFLDNSPDMLEFVDYAVQTAELEPDEVMPPLHIVLADVYEKQWWKDWQKALDMKDKYHYKAALNTTNPWTLEWARSVVEAPASPLLYNTNDTRRMPPYKSIVTSPELVDSQDLILVSIGALERMDFERRPQLFHEFYQILKPGGLLLFFDRNVRPEDELDDETLTTMAAMTYHGLNENEPPADPLNDSDDPEAIDKMIQAMEEFGTGDPKYRNMTEIKDRWTQGVEFHQSQMVPVSVDQQIEWLETIGFQGIQKLDEDYDFVLVGAQKIESSSSSSKGGKKGHKKK
eukprot:Nitzschia sp. Nitz4//scaffold167_size49223//30105//31316//NITZ4_007038-RA/size49223-processed-gene-0.33-mRNA-1//-1//CDS//3329538284//5548//frame0